MLCYCRVMEPLQYGDYPISMKTNAGVRIPAFTTRESEQVKGSFDFIGVIHYTNVNITDNSDTLKNQLRDYNADMAAKICKYFFRLVNLVRDLSVTNLSMNKFVQYIMKEVLINT
ncbi:hypothetical protein V8G54_030987 [Vigna mungo]|uniref:Uncharacterized protein n=1 Tax=Vigna mungo TaxID=3915 RepID=A0AAQ3MXF2_VIGMU